MNSRERFLATMAFQPVDRPPLWEFGYWAQTIRLWYQQGLPQKVGIPDSLGVAEEIRGEFLGWKWGGFLDHDVHDYLGLDPGMVRVPLNNFLHPEFERCVLEDHGDWQLVRDNYGIVRRQKKDTSTPPAFVRGPVTNREDFERLAAERLHPTLEGRIPDDWPSFVEKTRNRDFPLSLGGSQGFFGTLRYLLGEMGVLLGYYDHPDLMKAIAAYLADFWIALYDQILEQVHPDVAFIWEDMSYKNGPLISPAMFGEFMLPYYRKLTGFFRDHGIKVILVDTDGDCRALIPLFIKGGVTGLYPMEATGGMDVAAVGAAHPKLQLIGGLSKVAISRDPEAIDQELQAKVLPLIRRGGYIPSVDHFVPPEVSWQSFVYYRQKLASLLSQRS